MSGSAQQAMLSAGSGFVNPSIQKVRTKFIKEIMWGQYSDHNGSLKANFPHFSYIRKIIAILYCIVLTFLSIPQSAWRFQPIWVYFMPDMGPSGLGWGLSKGVPRISLRRGHFFQGAQGTPTKNQKLTGFSPYFWEVPKFSRITKNKLSGLGPGQGLKDPFQA